MTPVTVLTVTYGDRWNVLQETLASVLAHPSARVIVVSNGTRAASLRELQAFAAGTDRVEIVDEGRNRGSAPAFADGLVAAYRFGDPVLILDDDNPVPPDLLATIERVHSAVAAERVTSAPFALEVFRGVNAIHRAIEGGASVDHLFRELRPGAFQGFDLGALVRARIGGASVTRSSNASRTSTVRIDDDSFTLIEIPNAMWGGLYLPADVVAAGILPTRDLILYGDDNDFSGRLRARHIPVLLCLELRIDDAIVWKVPQAESRWLRAMPTTLQIPDSDAWRMEYLHRNQAHLSLAQLDGSAAARVRLAVNAVVRLGAIAVLGLAAGRPRYALRLIRASIAGLRGRLGETYHLPQ